MNKFLLVPIAALALLGGCGDEKTTSTAPKPPATNAYILELNTAQTEFAKKGSELNLANPKSPKEFSQELGKLDTLLDELIADTNDAKPPQVATKQHAKLVETLKEYQETLSVRKKDLVGKDQAKVQAAAEDIGKASTDFGTDFQTDIAAINKALGKR